MLSVYTIDKKAQHFERIASKTMKEKQWEKWKTKRGKEWLKNYRKRIENFVIDVDSNESDYEFAMPGQKNFSSTPTQPFKESSGTSHFIFSPYKNEKERIKETIERNKCYETVPIYKEALAHEFRNRDTSKEISGGMTFSRRSLPNLALSSCATTNNTGASFNRDTVGEQQPQYLKLHLKSAFSMLMKLGVLKTNNVRRDKEEDSPITRYKKMAEASLKMHMSRAAMSSETFQQRADKIALFGDTLKKQAKPQLEQRCSGAGSAFGNRSSGENTNSTAAVNARNKLRHREEIMVTSDEAMELAQRLSMKMDPTLCLPRIANAGDPISVAAEKVLLKTGFIKPIHCGKCDIRHSHRGNKESA